MQRSKLSLKHEVKWLQSTRFLGVRTHEQQCLPCAIFYPRVRPPTLTPLWAPAGLTVELRLAGLKLLFLDLSSLKRSSLRAVSQLGPSSVFSDSIFCLYKSVAPVLSLALPARSRGDCAEELSSSSSEGSLIRRAAVGVLKEVSMCGRVGVMGWFRICVVGVLMYGFAPAAASGVVGSSDSLSGRGAKSTRWDLGSDSGRSSCGGGGISALESSTMRLRGAFFLR